ncbi:MAG: acetyl/propionyl/methylcrotonyl-CoA carboxylase subunit alpha [Rhizobiaceae bacterium]
MFTRILIANRGEIACRVIRTARRMGVKTVAIYSDADGENGAPLHVRMADQSVPIGPRDEESGREPYLIAQRIIDAAIATGAQAIHPGYGFLSENPQFVTAVEKAGLVFVGPSAHSISAMGLKDAAKALMEKAGVPVVPGYHGEAQETVVLAGKANEIGYPVLIKARAGGGGKGMRKVDRAEDFREALASAKREARSAFGDERVLVEKYIEMPRHIEVQVFGDNHGNVVHLFERDCSLQRRHQKVIEEAPAPGMTEEMRQAMTDAAVKAARAINYSGAGTIEFIVDGSQGLRPDGFWFMEMNTRLQVEHPVTEAVTGLDLVEWQLRVAAGEKLPLDQEAITLNGHAFEARIYAEDVAKGFLPATGVLHHLHFPQSARIDTGVVEGDAISPFYDPMIAKLNTHGENRIAALGQLTKALGDTRIAGSVTNLGFLKRLSQHEGFASGEVDTGLIARDLDTLTVEAEPNAATWAMAALQVLGLTRTEGDPIAQVDLTGFALWEPMRWSLVLTYAGERSNVMLSPVEGGWMAQTPAGETSLHFAVLADGTFEVRHAGVRKIIEMTDWHGHVAVFGEGGAFEFGIPDPLAGTADEAQAGNRVMAPMPGLVQQVNAVAGQRVSRGDRLIVLEAMKMEHSLVAPRDGLIAAVPVSVGDQVSDGAILVELQPEE